MLAMLAAVVVGKPVRADHGFWPAGGVDPAAVAGHVASSTLNNHAGYWGTSCTTHDAGDDTPPGLERFDTYGAILARDYGVAVVVGETADGEIIDGPNALTVFLSPNAGEFVWADVDGDSVFRNDQAADIGTPFLCDAPSLPATDTTVGSPESGAPGANSLVILVVTGALAWVLIANQSQRFGARDMTRR
jgi:hypothetical protein